VMDGPWCVVSLPPGHMIKGLLSGATCHQGEIQSCLRVPFP
jgi:hypothetical protein